MTFGKVERDSMGIPVDYTPSPALRQIRQEEDKNAQARSAIAAKSFWGVPARRRVSAAGGRKPFLEWLAEMPPEEVAAPPPQKREMRRRWLDGKTRGEVRVIEANWRPGA